MSDAASRRRRRRRRRRHFWPRSSTRRTRRRASRGDGCRRLPRAVTGVYPFEARLPARQGRRYTCDKFVSPLVNKRPSRARARRGRSAREDCRDPPLEEAQTVGSAAVEHVQLVAEETVGAFDFALLETRRWIGGRVPRRTCWETFSSSTSRTRSSEAASLELERKDVVSALDSDVERDRGSARTFAGRIIEKWALPAPLCDMLTFVPNKRDRGKKRPCCSAGVGDTALRLEREASPGRGPGAPVLDAHPSSQPGDAPPQVFGERAGDGNVE